MRVSIVTISFNQAPYLEACLQSVLDQDYPDLEYIVVDPGSTDGSREIIERCADRIARVLFEPDDGPADGLNKGFAHATGDVLGYLNSDDVYLPNTVAKVVAHFANHPDTDVLYGDGMMLDADGRCIRPLYSAPWDFASFAHMAASAIQPATFFRTEAFLRAGGFNTGNSTCWDAELLLDLARSGATIRQIGEPLAGYRLYAESITGSGRLRELTSAQHRRIFAKVTGSAPGRYYYLRRNLGRLRTRLNRPRMLLSDFARFFPGPWKILTAAKGLLESQERAMP